MKTTLTVLLVITCTTLFSQTIIKGNARYLGGYEYNVYNSPVDYQLNDSVYMEEDTLIQSDFFQGIDVGLIGRTKVGKRKEDKLRYGYSLELARYPIEKAVNRTVHKGFFQYHRSFLKKWKSISGVSYTKSEKLGLNVLGSELLISLNYQGYKAEQEFEYKLSKKQKIKFSAIGNYKDYLKKSDEPTLTQLDLGGKVRYYHTFLKKHKLTLESGYRYKRFLETYNTSVLNPDAIEGDPLTQFLPDSLNPKPKWTWTYWTFKGNYKMEISDGFYVTPAVTYDIRTDISDGDFSYQSLEAGLKASYKKKKILMELGGSINNRAYRDRLAPINNETIYPTLVYNYLRAKTNFEWEFAKSFTFTLWSEFLNRKSNIEVNTQRTRRTYFNYMVMAGVRYNFEKKFKGKK